VEPETPTVKDGRYPLRRPVLLLSNNEPDPLVKAFEQFVTSDEGQKIVSEFYTPLPKSSSP
jgi:phosphate transport system substrate-binding protein